MTAVSPARATILALTLLALAATACGSGDDCAGFISVNATPSACEMLAEELGCSSFDAAGESCGLVACARCDGL
ncbi:MAG: hypothetical protein AB1689_07655 [Thermodesulfobacteriota bacterium]